MHRAIVNKDLNLVLLETQDELVPEDMEETGIESDSLEWTNGTITALEDHCW